MRDDDEDRPRRESGPTLGAPLDALSLHEIDERIEALRAEILRLEAARARKAAANASADAFFKK